MKIKLRNPLNLKKIKASKSIVIKLSSRAVTHASGGVNTLQIKEIINDIAQLRAYTNINIILVSSGSINAGRQFLGSSKKNNITHLQASSAIGQPILMQAFQRELERHDLRSAQVLLTHEDLKNKSRSHNVRSVIIELLQNNIIPIINENDCVSFDEITVGDNDQLSAMICECLNADTLCMLTKPDGLYDKDPEDPSAKQFPLIQFNDSFSQITLLTKSSAGRGGMRTKLEAVRKLTPLGVNVIICSFSFPSPILRALTQESGTLFLGNPENKNLKKKSWILTRVRPYAIIRVDQGAKEALLKNASLLPIGIISTSGKFNRGDSISIKYKHTIIAFGISEYSNKDVEKIKYCKSTELSSVLSYIPSKVVIHKDNLILKEG